MSWNDNVKKIIDFIPQFEEMKKTVEQIVNNNDSQAIDALEKKIDSARRTFSELYEQKIQLASQEQIALISELLAENDKLKAELKNKELNNG